MRTPTAIVVTVSLMFAFGSCQTWAADSKLAFRDDNQGNLAFDTGVVRGSIQKEGLGGGMKPIAFVAPDVPIDNNHGLLVPYRFLTPQKRYGFGSWEWPRAGRLVEGGAAEFRWAAATDRPFTLTSTLRWKAADTLDLTLVFTPDTDMEKFELFLGSYFRGFTKAKAYAQDAGRGSPGFVEAAKDKGGMQFFPAHQDVLAIVNDGRWKYPPYPNTWSFRPALAAPLGLRQEPKSGATVLVMAAPDDCFGLSMSQQEAKLGAFYLSLFGKDVRRGQTLTARVRLVFGQNITDQQAVKKYQEYLKDLSAKETKKP